MAKVLNVSVLQEYMASKGISERELADTMGVSHSTVYRALRGQRGVGGEFIARLMKTTEGDLSFDDLFSRDQVLSSGNGTTDQHSA